METNLIIVSHCKDEVVYFYNKINYKSIVVLVTKPQSQREREIFHRIIIELGCRCIELDEFETFDPAFELSQKSKNVLDDLVNIGPAKIYTQTKATMESDIVSRRVYDYIHGLSLKNHLVPVYNIKGDNKISHAQDRFLQAYANGDGSKLALMRNTTKSVVGFKLD